ncbi:hypothetical protein [Aestuariivivens sp. NBU2969]|uniref:hypothetical protein n=1 Tax=Aestuariivivens sp. NBU2969 TaxID=2873267 RepID=UPI001CC01099|nr:hypothetical protein [Aestuariivivens sp. NBU2969]
MQTRIIFFTLCFFMVTGIGFAQKNKEEKSIIQEGVAIKKYHNKPELERMPKGTLLGLYVERIESLVKLLPYIAFATKPGVTMSTLGIPNDKDNSKILDKQFEATDSFLEDNADFQKRILPYSDTDDLVSAILFYEETLKSLHEYAEFH